MSLSQNIDKYTTEIKSEIEQNNITTLSLKEKYINLKKILDRYTKKLTAEEILQFPSLFSRLVYLSQKYNIPSFVEWELQNFRVQATFQQRNLEAEITHQEYITSENALLAFVDHLCEHPIPDDEKRKAFLSPSQNTLKPNNHQHIRVQVVDIDRSKHIIYAQIDDLFNSIIEIKYNVENINEQFTPDIERLWINAQLNINNYKIDNSGYYIPKHIIFEPDYLIDTSAIAECFQNYGRSHLHYFRKKFEQTENSQHILLGNLANYFLDEIIYSEDLQSLHFNDVFLASFKQKPFEFTSCQDIKAPNNFRAFMSKASTQFENIKRVVSEDFSQYGINKNQCMLEPSFFCEKYGFQGRLDLLQLSENDRQPYKIVELKSGGLPYPKTNTSKIAINHEVQTAIYKLIIESVFNTQQRQIISSILYSAAENKGENLRFAATLQQLEQEIIHIRNQIVATEHDLYTATDNKPVEQLFEAICSLENYGKAPDFFRSKIEDFQKIIEKATSLERTYIYRFIRFITRELYIQKVGDDMFESNRSTASLWNTEFSDRKATFDLISDLVLKDIDQSGRDMVISFIRKDIDEFANFREGEICILYPHEKITDTVLSNQIQKGTIAKISNQEIILRFRYKQKNQHFFQQYPTWAIEHDRLDHSYNQMYKNLFQFLKASPEKKELLLGLKEPKSTYQPTNKSTNITLDIQSLKQDEVISKAIAAQNYFLIVGPPGTGKTSIFARRLIEHYYNNTQQNLLIIASTNKAVDELCDAINEAFNCKFYESDHYIRIGTELSCGENYRHRLLQNISNAARNREELRKTLTSTRIFIGTLASIVGKSELFSIKKFHTSIIDESSQILEPQIIGLLTNVDRFIMIGDHKQLSTISLQNEIQSQVNNEKLNIINLYNCNESLFERLYRTCLEKKWIHIYETLEYQGRMHIEVAEFPNKYFYNNILKPANKWQTQPLIHTQEVVYQDQYYQLINNKRIAFIDSSTIKTFQVSDSDKVSYSEAEIVKSISKAIIEIYKSTQKEFVPHKTLGVITQYRNQIALIRHKLQETGIQALENIMIDTVERFQGSQRDIIIISFCINKPYQLDLFCNLNNDKTVDRKLNVALTRARQQLFIVGNQNILRQNYLYNILLDNIS